MSKAGKARDYKLEEAMLAARRRRVAELYLKAMPMWEIAQQLNVSAPTISRDLKALIQEWREGALFDFTDAKAKELAKLDRLEREYWDAWEKSKKEHTATTAEKTESQVVVQGQPLPAPAKLKASTKKEDREGNPAYLAGVQWCITKRAEILGINSPISTANLNVDLRALSDEQLELLASGKDLFTVLGASRPSRS